MGKFSNTTVFTGLLERATSQLQLEPDWASILQICDCVRQQDVSPKFAVSGIKKKMFDRNPHVSKFALTVLEACVKNCGATFHDEIGTKEFMEEMRNLIKNGPESVKDTALGLIQTWSHAFRNESKYKIIQDTYNLMKMEGCQFPTFKESDAMFSADCAPAWAEGDVCHMCRVKFGTFIRQHHCRSCGQVFCKKCSSKESIIPQFGIEREVRVCDPCFLKLNPKGKSGQASDKSEKQQDSDLPLEYLNSALSKEAQVAPKPDLQKIKEQEEEELQLAMALSLSQEEAQKEKPISRSWSSSYISRVSNGSSSPTTNRKSTSKIYSAAPTYDEEADSSDMDPDLARYLNRSYWEGRVEKQKQVSTYAPPSAPVAQADEQTTSSPAPYTSRIEDQELANEVEQSSETLVNNLRSSLDMLSERIQTISGKGKHIAMDATVQSLFQTVSAMHPQLLRLIEQQEEETGKYESIKEKLGLVKDARVTLEAAREQHREKVRQQELEQDMLRRMQIEQKLELMRQQKAEYMAYQQRLQTERQIAMEQQHQQLRYQKYMPQQYAGQYLATDGGSPYSSMSYVPPSNIPPPVGVTQTDGSPYSSMNYVPTAGVPNSTSSVLGPSAPGVLDQIAKGAQQSYGQPAPEFQQEYAPPRYPGIAENSVKSHSPQYSGQSQAPPSYSQVEYAPYRSQVTDTQSLSNGQPGPEYQGPEVSFCGYQSLPPQQSYVSPPSSAPTLSEVQPQMYAQAGNPGLQQEQEQQLPPYEGNQKYILPQSQLPSQISYGVSQQQPAVQTQIQQPPMGTLQTDSGGYPSLQMQQQLPQMQSQPPHIQMHPQQMEGQQPQVQGQSPQLQGPQLQLQGQPPQLQGKPSQIQLQPPQMQGQSPQMQGQPQQLQGQHSQIQLQPPQMQGQPPQMQGQPPQMQVQQPQIPGQTNIHGSYVSPHQPHHHHQQQQPQQMYEPTSQQYQYASQQHQQPSGPPPQRQLSDLQLISFD